MVRESMLEAVAVKGFLPPKEVAHWRAPEREEFLQPQPDEVVSFVTFHECGLGYPRRIKVLQLHTPLMHTSSYEGTLIRRGCCTSLASSPSARLSLGWSRTWISFGGCSLGEP